MFAQVVDQTDKAARLLDSALKGVERTRGLRSGDRVYTPLIAAAEFQQGAAPSATVVFNVPADADFWAYRLLFYPYCKVVDPVNGTPPEITYRSTSFAGQSESPGVANPANKYSDFNTMVDGTFALIYEGKELQNVDTPMSAAYCSSIGKWVPKNAPTFGPNIWAAASQTPAGLVFDVPVFIPRGKSLACRMTPTYLGVRSITDLIQGEIAPVEITRQHMYKIVAVLEGEKKVTAFR